MGLTPVREYIVQLISGQVPSAGFYWSNEPAGAAKFQQLTGVTHATLMEKWFSPPPTDFSKTGYDPSFTTCTGFLTLTNNLVHDAGNLKRRVLQTMEMDKYEKGNFVLPSSGKKAEPGDYFLTKYTRNTVPAKHKNWVGMAHHVGVILEVSADGSMWVLVAGGAGGRTLRKDGVSRSKLDIKPEGLAGWLNVDDYYQGWTK